MRKDFTSAIRVLLAFVIALCAAAPAFAHGTHIHLHVAPDGADTGDCRDTASPCRTIQYALSVATPKMSEVRVAHGTYSMSDADVATMLATLVEVRGSYSRDDSFAVSDPAAHPTFIIGASPRYRQALSELALVLLDLKGEPDAAATPTPLTSDEAAALSLRVQTDGPFPCAAGLANDGTTAYPCNAVDMLGHIPLSGFSTNPASASNLWGFIDLNTNREYGVIGLRNGTAIVDVTVPTSPREIATIPAASSMWREVRVYQFWNTAQGRWNAYAYVVTEAAGQGIQIIDLSALPFTATLAANPTFIPRAHTIYIGDLRLDSNTTTQPGPAYAFVNGANSPGTGAFRVLDLSNPLSPTQVSVAASTYTHDGNGLVITDTRTAQCAPGHNPCEVYFDFAQTSLKIWDVTSKTSPSLLGSLAYYPNANYYTHSGAWLPDKMHLVVHDELDEYYNGHKTQVYIVDISNLTAPQLVNTLIGPDYAIDHNGYARGNRYFVSHYQRGLVVFDTTNPVAMKEVASFDTYPSANATNFNGAWGVYPYLPSGTILIGDIEGGLFVLRERPARLVFVPITVRNMNADWQPA